MEFRGMLLSAHTAKGLLQEVKKEIYSKPYTKF